LCQALSACLEIESRIVCTGHIFRPDRKGNKVPCHTFAVGADYTIPNPCRHIDRFTVSANYTGTGPGTLRTFKVSPELLPRLLKTQLYIPADRERPSFLDNKVSQPYYGLLNAKVSATKDFITFAIWAKNMTGFCRDF